MKTVNKKIKVVENRNMFPSIGDCMPYGIEKDKLDNDDKLWLKTQIVLNDCTIEEGYWIDLYGFEVISKEEYENKYLEIDEYHLMKAEIADLKGAVEMIIHERETIAHLSNQKNQNWYNDQIVVDTYIGENSSLYNAYESKHYVKDNERKHLNNVNVNREILSLERSVTTLTNLVDTIFTLVPEAKNVLYDEIKSHNGYSKEDLFDLYGKSYVETLLALYGDPDGEGNEANKLIVARNIDKAANGVLIPGEEFDKNVRFRNDGTVNMYEEE